MSETLESRESKAEGTRVQWLSGSQGFQDRDEKEMNMQKIQKGTEKNTTLWLTRYSYEQTQEAKRKI